MASRVSAAKKVAKAAKARLTKPRDLTGFNRLAQLFAAPDRTIRTAEINAKKAKDKIDAIKRDAIAEPTAELDRVGRFLMNQCLSQRELVFGDKASHVFDAGVKATIHTDTKGTFEIPDMNELAEEIMGIEGLDDLVTSETYVHYEVDVETLKARLKASPELAAQVTSATVVFKHRFKLETQLSASESEAGASKKVWEHPIEL